MRIALMLLFSASGTAHAFFDPPWITPAEPKSGETVSVNIRGGICDAIFFRVGYPQITREGNAIRLLEYGHHWDGELCIYDVGTFTEQIGAFSPGDYTLTVDLTYQDYFGDTQFLNIGIVSFAVAGAEPSAPVPASNSPSLIAFFLVVAGLAIGTLRTRRRSKF